MSRAVPRFHRVSALAPPLTGDAVRITTVTTSQSQLCMNVFDYEASALNAVNATNIVAVANAWTAANQAAYFACMTSDTTAVSISVQVPSSVSVASANVPWVGVGTVAGNQYPLEMAAVLSKYSALKGQHGRGRTYMPALPVSFITPVIDPNVLNATGIAAYNAFTAGLMGGLVVGGFNLSLAILTRPKKPITIVSQGVLVSRWVTQRLLGTVRRRREGRGI